MLIDKLIREIGDLSLLKRITVNKLQDLGYIVSTRTIHLCKGEERGTSVDIYEVLDGDTKRPVSFCYLYSSAKETGVILKNTFDHYQRE